MQYFDVMCSQEPETNPKNTLDDSLKKDVVLCSEIDPVDISKDAISSTDKTSTSSCKKDSDAKWFQTSTMEGDSSGIILFPI